MAGIFINYRREDSRADAGRLADALTGHFGADRVFQDLEMAGGEKFREEIARQIAACAVQLVVIGPRWLALTGPDGRPRLTEANDLLRLEIATALQRNVRVIPVLVGGAAMPSASQLPDDIKGLAEHNAEPMIDRHWNHCLASLIAACEAELGIVDAKDGTRVERRRPAPATVGLRRALFLVPTTPVGWGVRLLCVTSGFLFFAVAKQALWYPTAPHARNLLVLGVTFGSATVATWALAQWLDRR